jgi:hypothetical protein
MAGHEAEAQWQVLKDAHKMVSDAQRMVSTAQRAARDRTGPVEH